MEVAFDEKMFEQTLQNARSEDAERAFRALTSERLNEETLFSLLQAQSNNPSADLTDYPDLGQVEKGFADFGKRLFADINTKLYQFVCDKGNEDADLRTRVINAISGVDGGGFAIVVAALVGLGVPAGVAPIAAALVVKILLKPVAGQVCQVWAQKLQIGRAAE